MLVFIRTYGGIYPLAMFDYFDLTPLTCSDDTILWLVRGRISPRLMPQNRSDDMATPIATCHDRANADAVLQLLVNGLIGILPHGAESSASLEAQTIASLLALKTADQPLISGKIHRHNVDESRLCIDLRPIQLLDDEAERDRQLKQTEPTREDRVIDLGGQQAAPPLPPATAPAGTVSQPTATELLRLQAEIEQERMQGQLEQRQAAMQHRQQRAQASPLLPSSAYGPAQDSPRPRALQPLAPQAARALAPMAALSPDHLLMRQTGFVTDRSRVAEVLQGEAIARLQRIEEMLTVPQTAVEALSDISDISASLAAYMDNPPDRLGVPFPMPADAAAARRDPSPPPDYEAAHPHADPGLQ